MRILHMIPDIEIANGVMSVVLNYFKMMPPDIKFDVVYFSEKEKTVQPQIEALGGRVYKINPPSAKGILKHEMSRFFAAHKNEWEALHIHAPHFAVFIAPQAKKAGIKKICCHCHTTWYSLFPKNEFRNRLLAAPVKCLAGTRFACGTDAGKFWFKDNFYVLANAVDCAAFRFDEKRREKARQSLGLGDCLVCGNVGRLYPPQKNHPFILKIFAEVKKQRSDAKLLLVGAEKEPSLLSLAKKLEIEKDVLFLGQRRDVADLLFAMDVFLFPSLREGLPVAAIEAQASGLPVLMASTITREALVAPNAKMLSLQASPREWANAAVSAALEARKDNYDIMKAAGWDIKDRAARLAEYYRTGVFRDF